MARDLSFASQKVPKSGPSAIQKCEDQLMQAGFAVIFSAVFGRDSAVLPTALSLL